MTETAHIDRLDYDNSPSPTIRLLQPKNLSRMFKVCLAAFSGAMIGSVVSFFVIVGFAAMILTPFLNIYYAIIFAACSFVYIWRIIKKNRISLSMDDTAQQSGYAKANLDEPDDDQLDMEFEKSDQFEVHTKSGTGGSPTNNSNKNAGIKGQITEFFRRAPLITESRILYKRSLMLTDNQNECVSRFNFYLEVTLTVGIMLSSLLTLTLEKNWWGGFLGSEKNYGKSAGSFQEWMANGKRLSKPNPAYLVENSLRLMVVGTSITFFLTMMFVECFQGIYSCLIASQSFVRSVCQYLGQLFGPVLSSMPEHRKSFSVIFAENLTDRNLIDSNLQMLIVMVFIVCFGSSMGILQATEDPEAQSTWYSGSRLFGEELHLGWRFGSAIGAVGAVVLELVRQRELSLQLASEFDTPSGSYAVASNLNYEVGDYESDFSGEYDPLPDLTPKSETPTFSYDEDEENIDLVDISRKPSRDATQLDGTDDEDSKDAEPKSESKFEAPLDRILELKSDSESDEDDSNLVDLNK